MWTWDVDGSTATAIIFFLVIIIKQSLAVLAICKVQAFITIIEEGGSVGYLVMILTLVHVFSSLSVSCRYFLERKVTNFDWRLPDSHVSFVYVCHSVVAVHGVYGIIWLIKVLAWLWVLTLVGFYFLYSPYLAIVLKYFHVVLAYELRPLSFNWLLNTVTLLVVSLVVWIASGWFLFGMD